MDSTVKQLSYNVQKNIIEHLKLETRLDLSAQCPAIKTLERKTNLHLQNLTMESAEIQINDLSFRTETYRKEEDGSLSEYPTMLKDNPLEPGDLAVRSIFENEGFRDEFDAQQHVSFISVKLKNKSVRIQIEKGPSKALKKIADFYFSDRGDYPVKIDCFTCRIMSAGTLRLPDGFQMDCRELRVGMNATNVLTAIRPVLVTKKVEKITILVHESSDPAFQEELVRSADYLKIEKLSTIDLSIIDALVELENRKVHVCFNHFLQNDIVTLARRWIWRKRAIGTVFTLGIRDYDWLLDVIDVLVEEMDAERGEIEDPELRHSVFRHCATMRINSASELNVFGGPVTEKWPTNRWNLRMEVMPRGSARIVGL